MIRKAIKAVADHFYPPATTATLCADGNERMLGDEQYLNRLQEFVTRQFASTSSDHLLKAEIDLLSAFIRRLNDIASKGVHADVAHVEAKQGVIGLYMFLYNLIVKLEGKS